MKKQCFHVSSIVNKVSQLIRAKNKNKKKYRRAKEEKMMKRKRYILKFQGFLFYFTSWGGNIISFILTNYENLVILMYGVQ